MGDRMALKKRGKWRYGDSQADIRLEILRYSKGVRYLAEHFADAVCECGSKVFGVSLDANEGVASRVCVICNPAAHPIGDSAEYMDETPTVISNASFPHGHAHSSSSASSMYSALSPMG